MRTQKLKQLGLILCCIVSLFASSISACVCSHHQEKTETEITSCHSHSENVEAQQHHDTESAETFEVLDCQDDCVCMQPAPKVLVKAETIKIERHSSVISPLPQVEIVFVSQTISVKSEFITPFYLTDSFYNLSPGRAPPIL